MLYAVDCNGVVVDTFEGSGQLSYPVVAMDGLLVVSDSAGKVWTLGERPASGPIRWRWVQKWIRWMWRHYWSAMVKK